MIKVTKTTSLLLFVLLLVRCQMSGRQSIPTAYFFNENKNREYHISPDGAFVSCIETQNNVSNIFISNVISGYKTQITYLKIGNIKSYYWANDNTIFYIDTNPDGEFLHYVNTKGRGNYRTLKANKIEFIVCVKLLLAIVVKIFLLLCLYKIVSFKP